MDRPDTLGVPVLRAEGVAVEPEIDGVRSAALKRDSPEPCGRTICPSGRVNEGELERLGLTGVNDGRSVER